MEEFKRPTFPITPSLIAEKDELEKNNKEDLDKSRENAQPIKSTNPYKIPKWSERAKHGSNYSLEVLKSGQIIDEIRELQKKPFWSFGRLAENDIEMAHPTISRFHAILQYRPKGNSDGESNAEGDSPPDGWYIYDLGSTHGTFLNKQRLPPKVYIRIRVGHLLKLGASTRSYILQGPAEDAEPESDLSITEIKAKRHHEIEKAALEKKRLADEAVERAGNEGCSWGMAEDADEESDLIHNPYASTNNEELFLDDPKKTLRGYFERECMELVYKCDEMSAGSFVCRVELPIDDTNGRSIVAEVVHKGKKKDCVFQCALEACRILDRHGVLRQANQEPLRRKQKRQESDSDEDEFWDRTGDVAKKKERKAAANVSVTFTYEDLLKQDIEIDEQLKAIEDKIDDYQKQQQRIKALNSEGGEDLDTYMEHLNDKEVQFDKTEIRKLRLEEQRLKNEKCKVQRLIKIAKPVEMTFAKHASEEKASSTKTEITVKKQLPMIGKRKQFSKFKILNVPPNKEKKPAKLLNSDEEEQKEAEMNKNTVCKKDTLNTENPKNEDLIIVNKIEQIPETTETNESNTDQDDAKTCMDGTSMFLECESKKESEASNKKRRHRIRQRNKREDVNDNEDYESSEKYAKWLPPENQTGDGLTELNEKFGY